MHESGSNAARASYVVLVTALAVCVLSSLFMMPYLPDDSYISFRYAENLANGNGLTFNAGEQPVEGYSNLLWILFCAFLHQSGLDLPSFMPYVGILLGMLNILVLWLIFRRRRLPPLQTLFPLLLLAASGPFVTYVISGMETPLYALLLLLAVNWLDLWFVSGKLSYAVLLALTGVSLSLCRPEGVVVFPLVAAATLWLTRKRTEDTRFFSRRIKHVAISGGIFLVIVVVYHVWRVGYFGEVLPTPLLSKGGGGKSVINAWVQNAYMYFVKQGDYYPPAGYYFVALVLAGVLGWRLSASTSPLRRADTVALILGIAHVAIYCNFKDWMPAMRYHAALVGLFLATAVHVQTPFFKNKKSLETPARLKFWLTGAAVLMMSCSLLASFHVITSRAEESNQKCLVRLGKWLREIMPRNSVLAISDVGAIPYYSRFRTIDIHPESLTDLYIAKNGFSIEYIYRRKPDIIILPSRSQFVTRFSPEHHAFAEDERFQRLYRFIGASRFDWQHDRSYWIFIPRPYPKIPKAKMDRFPHGIGTIRNIRE